MIDQTRHVKDESDLMTGNTLQKNTTIMEFPSKKNIKGQSSTNIRPRTQFRKPKREEITFQNVQLSNYQFIEEKYTTSMGQNEFTNMDIL